MNDTILLESENFALSLTFQVFESDISYPSNTILSISVSSAAPIIAKGFVHPLQNPCASKSA